MKHFFYIASALIGTILGIVVFNEKIAVCVENDEDSEDISFRNEMARLEMEFQERERDWDCFTEAMIWRESRGKENAIGDGGKAVGVLQLHKIMVDDANRICRMNGDNVKYTYNDRYSREKSIEIFNIIQEHYNLERDKEKACDIWNSGHYDEYYTSIMDKYEELKLN